MQQKSTVSTIFATKSSILDSISVEGQHTELLVCNQGTYLL